MEVLTNLPIELRAGGIVFRLVEGKSQYLLVTSNSNRERWIIPAGHVEKGEYPEQTAIREVLEEAGVETQVMKDLGEVQYHWYRDNHKLLIKTHLYLMKYIQTIVINPEGRQVSFFTYDEVMALNLWDETRQFFCKAKEAVEQIVSEKESI